MTLQTVLYDRSDFRNHLMPLVSTRPLSMLRVGILSINEKWHLWLNASRPVLNLTDPQIQEKYPCPIIKDEYVLLIHSAICPDEKLVQSICNLTYDQCLVDSSGDWIAAKIKGEDICKLEDRSERIKKVPYHDGYVKVRYFEDLVSNTKQQLALDYKKLDLKDNRASLSDSNRVWGEYGVSMGENVYAQAATFNSIDGPIYIADDVIIEEGSHLKGPLYIGAEARVKMGSKIYGNVSIGKGCTVGGEINNSIIMDFSNKGHEGYLGNSIIGENCNIGSGTNVSNLQNNWSYIKVYDYKLCGWRSTEVHKFGLIMGDYAMCGINTSFTTGTIVGVGAQIAISHLVDKWVPDFTWNTDQKREIYKWDGFVKMIENKSKLQNNLFSTFELEFLKNVYQNLINREIST